MVAHHLIINSVEDFTLIGSIHPKLLKSLEYRDRFGFNPLLFWQFMGNVELTILSSTDIVLPYVFKVTVIVFWFLAFKGSEDAIEMGRPFAPLARTVGVGVVAAA